MFSNEDYLAELLAEAGLVSADDVAHARNALYGAETIIEHLLSHTTLTQEDVAQTLAANAGIPFVRLGDRLTEGGVAFRVVFVRPDRRSATVADLETM